MGNYIILGYFIGSGLGGIILLYCFYQILIIKKVCRIRVKWIYSKDSRLEYYDNHFMSYPGKHNLYGFRFPKESHFPPK